MHVLASCPAAGTCHNNVAVIQCASRACCMQQVAQKCVRQAHCVCVCGGGGSGGGAVVDN